MTKISNMSDTQLLVQIVGANGDKDYLQLQPKGSVELPEGFEPVNPKQKSLYTHPEVVKAVIAKAPKVADKGEGQ